MMGPENVAAFMSDPGSCPDEYWPIIRGICDKYGILLILDEIVTGWGRTGTLFACEHWNIIPDILVMGKALSTAYLPMSAMAYREHVYQAFAERKKPWPYGGHTLTGYPAGCACALATIDVIVGEKLPENAATIGAHIKERLEKIYQQSEIVGSFNGTGLKLGLEIVEDKKSKVASARAADLIRRRCRDNGVLFMAGGASLSISPPLIITEDEADRLCDVLEEAIKKTEAQKKGKRK